MKKLIVLFSMAMLAFAAPEANAQARTVTGRVTSEAGQPVAGATVTVQGTTIGAVTNAEGRYTINVPAAARTLVFSSPTYGRTEVAITGDVVNATLSEAVTLEGVVVTALGIERQERALGVAAQQVQGEELSRSETNIVNTLQGRVAGVQITNAGAQGGSSRIVIRGASSLTGNNQPLWVVDGVPIDNYSGMARNAGVGAIDYGNAVQDIAPENIESITVLKGPNAAALYGSRASGGAIIVTTRTGRSGGGRGQITASQQISWEDPLRLPDWQDQFGQGLNGRFRYVNGLGGGVYDEVDESWGPPLDGRLIEQYNSPIVNGVRQATPWVAHPDNVDYFFETGNTLTTNASFGASSEQANVRLSLSRLNQDGMMPGFSLGRTTVGLNGGVNLTSRLSATGSAQYVGSNGGGRPGIGYGETNPMIQFVWFGRQVDTRDLQAKYNTVRPEGDTQAGRPYSWNYSYHPNPYFLQQVNGNSDERNRLIGNVAVNYEFTPWLSGLVRSGTDWYNDDRRTMYAEGNYGVTNVSPITGGSEVVGDRGAFGQYQIGFQETNTDFLLTVDRDLSSALSLNANFGGNRRDFRRQTNYVWVAGLSAPGIYSTENASETPDPFDYLSRKRVNSLYGQTEFGFNDYLFLTLTGRNDWSSTLPEENNSYFYPSVQGSFILSDAIPALSNGPMSYAKLRASWARVGSDADPYQLVNTYLSSPAFNGFPRFEVANSIKNANLRPESTESWEVGTELGFFNNRIGLDLTYYNEVTSDQIMPVQLSRATGFSSSVVNAGSVRNKGIEVLLNATPIQAGRFRWESTLTYARNRNEVESLAAGLQSLTLGNFWYGSVQARPGEPYGAIVGTTWRRDSQGRVIVNATTGAPLRDPTQKVIGNYNPDWTGGWANSLSLGGLNLNVLIDTRQGGNIYSVTNQWGTYAGVLEQTVKGRCLQPNQTPVQGIPTCNKDTGIVVDGVKVVRGDTVPNDVVISAQSYWTNSGMYATTEANLFDASFTKLREVTLTYELPTGLTNRFRISGLQLGVTGRNLALWGTDNPHIDPETAFDASNVQGLEFGQIPTPRSIGINVSIQP